MLKDQQLDGLSTCKKNGLGLLAELQTMKFEGLVIEAFRQLKIKENLKRVVCKNLADVASGKVVEGSVLSQILQQCNELLEGWSGVCHCKVYRIGRDTHKDRKKGLVHCWKLSDFSTCSMLFPYLLICSYILPYSPCWVCFFLVCFFLGLFFCLGFLFFVCFFHNFNYFLFSNEWRSLDVISLNVLDSVCFNGRAG